MNRPTPKITFCTSVMNRLHHLKSTLPQNLKDTSSYPDVEFLILDYNSTDGLEDWIRTTMEEHILSGRLSYYRTIEPKFFHRSHSRNLSFKLATGSLLCNLDADNFTGTGFAEYIATCFEKNPNIFLSCIDFRKEKANYHPPPDSFGRICCSREAFWRIKGYNEQMSTHGFQDYDFANRLEISGLSRVLIENTEYLKAVKHDDTERFGNEFINRNLTNILYKPKSPYASDIIFLYRNQQFERGTLVYNDWKDCKHFHCSYKKKKHKYQYSLTTNRWNQGKWAQIGPCELLLSLGNCKSKTVKFQNGQSLSPLSSHPFQILKDEEIKKQLIIFNTQFTNRNIMQKNWDKKIMIVNKKSIGTARVFKNFNYAQPISV